MKANLVLQRYAALMAAILLIGLTACAPAPAPTPSTTPPPPSAPAQTPPVPPAAEAPPGSVDASAVDSQQVTFASEGFTIKAYLSKPKTGASLPGLIIIHENRGLTGHIEDVTRRYANQGYAVLAPDLLSRVGGTAQFATTDEAVAAIGKLASEGIMQDLDAAFQYLRSLSYVNKDRIGVLGYCWGGGNSLLYATHNQDLEAAVVYYGPNPANIENVANIAAPVLGIYGALDTRITVNVPALEETMKKYGKSFEHKVYPGAAHAFFNDTGTRYHTESARDAWQLTNSFLERQLKK
ncbi:MAG: dienelactone hydrolase family protein [Chloroflexi bacterium]|nr:dienelactone hydrolase family protein [Chloroflexota bacterium]